MVTSAWKTLVKLTYDSHALETKTKGRILGGDGMKEGWLREGLGFCF